MASCFQLRTVLFGWISYLYFYHITSQMYLYHLRYLGKKENRSHLTRSSMGPDSSAPRLAALFSLTKELRSF